MRESNTIIDPSHVSPQADRGDVTLSMSRGLLGLTADSIDTAAFDVGRAVTFTRVLLLYLSVRDWHRVVEQFDSMRLALSLALSVALLLSFALRYVRVAIWIAWVAMTVKFVWVFPDNSNHFMVEFVCLSLVVFLDSRHAEERALLLRTLRWLVVIAFFGSGVQKVLHGTYTNGAFIASAIDFRSFGEVMSWVLPADQLAAIRHAVKQRVAGEIRLHGVLPLAASNLVYIGELLAALLLLTRRLRLVGVALSLGLLLAIELGARELMFGVLMTNLVALFVPRLWSTNWCVANAVVLAVLVAGATGLVPLGEFN